MPPQGTTDAKGALDDVVRRNMADENLTSVSIKIKNGYHSLRNSFNLTEL